MPFLLALRTQATPTSSAQKMASPEWRPFWAWYLAAAPALSAVAGNPVPELTLLRGFSPPEIKPYSLCGGGVFILLTSVNKRFRCKFKLSTFSLLALLGITFLDFVFIKYR